MMFGFPRLVLGHKLVVLGFWLVTLVAGVFAAPAAVERLSDELRLPGEPGFEANAEILQRYGNGGAGYPLVPVVTLPNGIDARDFEARSRVENAFSNLATDPRFRVVSYPATGDEAFVSDDGQTVFGLVFVPFAGQSGSAQFAPAVREAVRQGLPQGATVRVTGLDQLSEQTAETGTGVLIETLVAALGALIVLAVVFGSLLALVPLLVAAVSILATFLAVLGLTTITDVSFIVQFLVALIGFGVAVDYSLLLVTRWREERTRGLGREEAVAAAMATAGRAVVVSGVTVALGLLVLVLVPVDFIQSIGYAGVLIPLVSVAVTLTLLPVLLATAGPRLDWPRLRTERGVGPVWTRWATGVARHRWLAGLAALALLLPLVVAAFGIRLGEAPAESLPGTGPPRAALQQLNAGGVPNGVLTPIEVLVPAGRDPDQVARVLREIDGIYTVLSPDRPDWRQGGTALVEVLPVTETSLKAGQDTVKQIRQGLAQRAPGAQVGGTGAPLIDSVETVYGNVALMLAAIVAATFVLLTRAFRSLVLAAQAVILNLVSIAAAYGAVVLIWQQGYGSELIWDIPATGAITFFVPLLAFAFLYGLSMDYEVFLLSRMRETYDETRSTHDAVVQGLGRVGRLVTSAALILFLAFASLASTPRTEVKIIATTLGAGILLDATVLRALLVPALVAITGRWSWWLPRWASLVLRVPASPPAPREKRVAAAIAYSDDAPHREPAPTGHDHPTPVPTNAAHHQVAASPPKRSSTAAEPSTDSDGATTTRTVRSLSGARHVSSRPGPRVTGRITHIDGSPASDVALTLIDLQGRQVDCATTDLDGRYQLVPPTQEPYILITLATGYRPRATTVTPEDQPKRHDMSLRAACSIGGLVRTRATDEPVPDATVTLLGCHGAVIAVANSRSDGSYNFNELPEGRYALTAISPQHRPVADTVTVDLPRAHAHMDLELHTRARLTGTVTSATSGRPLDEVLINLLDPTGAVVATAITDPHGRYTADKLTEGSYTLTATSYTPLTTEVTLADGDETNAEITMQPADRHTRD